MKRIAIIGDRGGSVVRAILEAQANGSIPADVNFVELQHPAPQPIQTPGYGGPVPKTIPSPYAPHPHRQTPTKH